MALDYTITFNGLTIGNGTSIQIMGVEGLEDLPPIRTDDVDLGYQWGETPGIDYPDGRDITVDILILDSGVGDYFTKVEQVKAASLPGTESTLVFQLPGRNQRSMICRARRRRLPVSQNYQYRYGAATLEFHATDPRIYDTSSSSWSLPVFVAGNAGWDATAGAGVDAGWDATAGTTVDAGWDATSGAVGAGLVNAINSGTIDMYPQIVFSPGTGMSSWRVTNQTTGQILTINQTLNTGETLIADMQIAATGKPGLPISVGGAGRYGSWQSPRTPFALIPGLNVLRFDVLVGDQNAAALVTGQPATL